MTIVVRPWARMALFILRCSPRSVGTWIMNLYPAPLHCWHNYLSTLSLALALRITCIRQARFCTARSPILHDRTSKKFRSLSWCVASSRGVLPYKTLCFTNRRTPESEREANFTTRPSSRVKSALYFICLFALKLDAHAVGVINYKTARGF